jgi:hypothetical protein
VASGRAEQLADARSRAEERFSPMRKAAAASVGVGRLTNRRLARLYWRALDTLYYWLTQAQLWLVDAG